MRDNKVILKIESEHTSMAKECYEDHDNEIINKLCIVHFNIDIGIWCRAWHLIFIFILKKSYGNNIASSVFVQLVVLILFPLED